MKNQKYFIGAMIAILVVVYIIIRSGENLGSDFEKVRLKTDSDMGLNMKSNTFRFTRRPLPPPSAPTWGSFKTAPITPAAVTVSVDKNQDILKTIAKKVADKLKDEKKKKAKKVAAAKKKKGVTLIKTADSRVSRAMRRLDDGMSSKRPPIVPVAFARPPQQGQASPQSAGADDEKEDVRTLEDWQSALLRRANPEETESLIAQYQKNELGDPKWAFALAEQMLESDDEEIQKQGVTVLDRLPSEPSFALLTKYSKVPDHPQAALLKKSLDSYAAYEKLTILERSVRSTNATIQIQAAKSIDQSGQKNLASTPQSPRGQRGETGTATSTAVHLRYQQTVVILEAAHDRSKSIPGQAAITETINNLNEMLGARTNPSVEIANQ
jgi:hypothetical protein